jgi:hypothetical protein
MMTLLYNVLLGFSGRMWLTAILPALFFTYWVVWVVYARTVHPLAKVPGPFWATVSRIWLMYRACAGDLDIEQRKLHDQYGPLLRVAPGTHLDCRIDATETDCNVDEVVYNDPRAISLVYPLRNPLQKTVWYDAWRPASMKSRPDMFTNRSEQDHASYQRVVGHVYSLSSVLKSEAKLDECKELFVQRLNGFADRNEEFDFGIWLEMFCYDNIGIVFFGKQFGFLKDSIDYGGYIAAVHSAMPFLHLLAMAPVYARPFLMVGALAVPTLFKAVLAVDGVKKTAERETYEAEARTEEVTAKRVDMTSQLLGIVRDKGEKSNFGLNEIISENWTAV